MARRPRISVPGHVYHVILRGNSRQLIAHTDTDRAHFLKVLFEYAEAEAVSVHAYVLMSNHLHLLVTPTTDGGMSRMIQGLGRRYVAYFNKAYERTGGLFEGRYKSTLVDTERYLLVCHAYLDLNPVRAGMVEQAGEYRWSSYGFYAGTHNPPFHELLRPHPLIWSLGNTPFSRQKAYQELVASGLSTGQTEQITQAALKSWPIADLVFIQKIEQSMETSLQKKKAGRPFKTLKSEIN